MSASVHAHLCYYIIICTIYKCHIYFHNLSFITVSKYYEVFYILYTMCEIKLLRSNHQKRVCGQKNVEEWLIITDLLGTVCGDIKKRTSHPRLVYK